MGAVNNVVSSIYFQSVCIIDEEEKQQPSRQNVGIFTSLQTKDTLNLFRLYKILTCSCNDMLKDLQEEKLKDGRKHVFDVAKGTFSSFLTQIMFSLTYQSLSSTET